MASLSSVTDYLEVLVAEQAKEKSADSVLAVSALVRQAKENLSEEDFTDLRERAGSVSYTHLTLPTILLV